MSVFIDLVSVLGRLLEPVLAESATAAAIVLFTVLVRLALHPLSRAAFRGATPVAGLLPVLLQLPVFFLMYRAFSSAEIGGAANELLGHRLFAAPLGDRWGDALGEGGLFGERGLVFLGLFAVVAVVAAWSAVRGRKAVALAAATGGVGASGAQAGRAGGAGKAGGASGAEAGGLKAGGDKVGGGNGGRAKADTGKGGRAKADTGKGGRAKADTGKGGRAKVGGGVPGGKGSGGGGAGAVAGLSAEQQELMRKLGGVLPLLSFGTLITAALVPLAAGLYLVTTTAWSVAERIWLQHRKDRAEPAGRAVSGAERSAM
ncbi:YidC/Oxa1 family membrane protein insertase [Streptomyces sp. AP-93]|uniref:YidC/Oxa1 family membrane protein insertase n=1 Tax=Streptomyces sp. AP-93 TaxID=2929048 RepID=UPI001FAF3062|nr:YidC/Oxa1 family membrane protein insertase [Streptomyces sp. AP-93]MCJ0872200.1 YidC/Oxa1 family membrane protein insertase [Streptomyces sp. AP-93]